jgi:N6-adenosine-specific RNA methylase IME4
MVDQQLALLPRWGFRFVTSGVWVKRTKTGKLAFGTGYRLRCASEPFLIATNGEPTTARNIRTVIEGPLREHSRKPDEAYVEAEKMFPNVARADLFSRKTRPGWDAWGDEAGKFDAVEVAA